MQILRVAALNNAAFEWIQHEAVGREGGLTNGQLYIIRDVATPLPPMEGIFTPLQAAAIAFTDASTKDVSVPKQTSTELMNQLRCSLKEADAAMGEEELKAKAEDLYVEAAMVVAAYNMVSRFLVATDVGGLSDLEVPWPVDVEEVGTRSPLFLPLRARVAISLWFFFSFSIQNQISELTVLPFRLPFLQPGYLFQPKFITQTPEIRPPCAASPNTVFHPASLPLAIYTNPIIPLPSSSQL